MGKPSVNVPTFVLGMATFVAFIQRLFVLPGGVHYQNVMKLTMGIWCAYPVMFVICEMTHMVASDIEVWMYCILDVAAKCGCGFLLVNGHERGGKAAVAKKSAGGGGEAACAQQ